MKPNPYFPVLTMLQRDHVAGLNPPEELWLEDRAFTDPLAVPPFRSPYETIGQALHEQGRDVELRGMLDHLYHLVDANADELPDCDLLAAVALLSMRKAAEELVARCNAYIHQQRPPRTLLELGRELLRLHWAFLVSGSEQLRNVAHGLLVFATEQWAKGRGLGLPVFMPDEEGFVDMESLAVAEYAFAVGDRVEPMGPEKMQYKALSGDVCTLMQDPRFRDSTYCVAMYNAAGEVHRQLGWTANDDGSALIAAAIGHSHPVLQCGNISQQLAVLVHEEHDVDGRILDPVRPEMWGSPYEIVQQHWRLLGIPLTGVLQ